MGAPASLLKPGETLGPDPHAELLKPGEKFSDDSPGDPGVPNIPPSAEQITSGITRRLGKILPRIGTQVGGAEVGGALGALSPIPGGAIIGAGIGGGIGNVVGSKLPEAIGGDPTESTLHAFGWGAGPEGAARAIAGLGEARVLKSGAEDSYQKVLDALDKGANPMPSEQAGRLATAVGRTTLESAKPLTGDALSQATGSLRRVILDPITEMRRRLGEPIGRVYEALKGDATPLQPDQFKNLQEAAQGTRDNMLSPFPKAKAIFHRIKNLSPPEPPEWMKPTYQGEHPPRAVSVGDFAEVEKYEKAVENYKPPTWDEIRELRQANNQILRSAKGGDAHAAGQLQQALDEQLLSSGKVPADINEMRSRYREFMNRFPWRDVTKINNMGTPRELGNYVFGGTPERTAEIINEVKDPNAQSALREALTNRALDAVNPDAPLSDQIASVRKVLTPYIKNGSAAALYGAKNADEIRNIFYLPEHLQQMKQVVETPEFHEGTSKEVVALMRSGSGKMDAVERGWQKVIQSLPPKTRALLEQPTLPGVQMPVLPSTTEALEGGLKPGASGVGQRIARRAEFTVPMAGGRAMMGSPQYAIGQLAAMAGIATTSAGYRAFMDNGGAGMIAKMYASGGGRATARALIETLAAIGTQGERAVTKPEPIQTP